MALNPALAALVKQAKNKYAKSNNRTVKLKEGKTVVRILQAPSEDQFWRDLGVHWIKFEERGKPVAVVGDPDTVYSKPSKIATAIDKAIDAATDDEVIKVIKSWKAKKSVLVNALIRSGADQGDDPQILELTTTTFSKVLAIMDEYQSVYDNILDPNKGIDLVFERKGKGLDTEYTVMPAPKSDPVPKGALDRLNNLDEFIEREFFKGDEVKALNAISEWTGLDLTAIGGPSSAAARLSAPVADAPKLVSGPVADMTPELLTPPARPAAPVAPAPAPAPAPAADNSAKAKLEAARKAAEAARLAAELAELEAAAEAEEAATAAVEAPAAPVEAPAPAAAANEAEDIASILSELDNL